MSMEVPRVGSDATVDEVEEALRASGCVVVERLVPIEHMDRIESDLEPFLDATPPGGDEFTGFNTIAYDEVSQQRMGTATSFYTTFQQLMLSMGICAGAAALQGAMVLRGQRMPTDPIGSYEPPFCPEGRCESGPYEMCDAAPTGCQYREDPRSYRFPAFAHSPYRAHTGRTPGIAPWLK